MENHNVTQYSMLRIFQISMALLISLSGLTAAIAEDAVFSAFTLPISLATLYFVDIHRKVFLPSWLVPILGVLAFLVAGGEYVLVQSASYLSVGNHLLACLVWILLGAQKQQRQYWTLLALSILQVAVTSLLTYSIWFGVALVAYSLLATWTLSIFLLQRSAKALREPDAETLLENSSPVVQSEAMRVWPSVSLDRNERLITPRFWFSTGGITGVSLVMAGLFFLFIPRIWSGPMLGRSLPGAAPLTGFTSEVRLGDIGEILENEEKVMEVQVSDSSTDLPLPAQAALTYLGAEPLFRGSVMDNYQQGRWHRVNFKSNRNLSVGIPEAKYRLRFRLAPINTETIFSFGNMVGAATTSRTNLMDWDYFSCELHRSEDADLSQEFDYDLYTMDGPPDLWLSGQRQQDDSSPRRSFAYQRHLRLLTSIPEDLRTLVPVAQRVARGAASPRDAAQKIEDWFTTSGEFDYTMKLTVADSSIDPILDFLMNRKTGHCEYFASSMAILLRCLQIPSRLITGFKGGVFDPRTGRMQVHQYHAHAWVEAFIDGHWVTFDPTPGSRDESVASIQGQPSSMALAWRRAEAAWNRFSMLSREGQGEKIYRPIVQRARIAKQIITDVLQGRISIFKRAWHFLSSPERWLSPEGGVVAFLLLLLGIAAYRLIRLLFLASYSLQGYLKSQAAFAADRPPRVPFFERLLAILKRHGITPQPTQTAREFIHDALPQLAPRLAACGLNAWPEEVVDKFYRVRFGRQPLSPQEVHEMEKHLVDLEKCLQLPLEGEK